MANHTYRVMVEGIGLVYHGHDHSRAMSIYLEYCQYSRQETSSLAGLDVSIGKDGVEVGSYRAPRPYPR
jgi:hypothetical protein